MPWDLDVSPGIVISKENILQTTICLLGKPNLELIVDKLDEPLLESTALMNLMNFNFRTKLSKILKYPLVRLLHQSVFLIRYAVFNIAMLTTFTIDRVKYRVHKN